MKQHTVLISGAGIAGTVLANELQRHGFAVTVVEKAPEIRLGGYKVDLRGAAIEVADRMGILEAARDLRTEVRSGSVVNAAGHRVASMDGDTFGGRGHDDVEILRGDLQRIIAEAAPSDVHYRFADSIVDLAENAANVDVSFANGDHESFDLVVGADGMRSNVRQKIFGNHERFLHSLGFHVCVFSVPNLLDLDREELTYISPGRTALVYSTARAAESKAMFLFNSSTLPIDHPPDPDRAAQEHMLAEVFKGEKWEIARILEHVHDSPDFLFDSISQIRMDSWSHGRVVLVGDAAHCASVASGQGTSLAFVGAYTLACELIAAAGEHDRAFRAYEHRLRGFVHENQKLGPANMKRMVVKNSAQVRVSMAMLGLMNRLPFKERILNTILQPIGRAATAVTLP